MFNFDISYILSNKGIFMEDTSHKDLKKSVYLLVDSIWPLWAVVFQENTFKS